MTCDGMPSFDDVIKICGSYHLDASCLSIILHLKLLHITPPIILTKNQPSPGIESGASWLKVWHLFVTEAISPLYESLHWVSTFRGGIRGWHRKRFLSAWGIELRCPIFEAGALPLNYLSSGCLSAWAVLEICAIWRHPRWFHIYLYPCNEGNGTPMLPRLMPSSIWNWTI